MTVNQLVDTLQELQDQGMGDLQVTIPGRFDYMLPIDYVIARHGVVVIRPKYWTRMSKEEKQTAKDVR